MSKKPNQESKELNNFLSDLTDIGLETDSKAIFQLTETLRDSDLFESEKEVLKSFLEWARLEGSRFIKPVGTEINLDRIDPNQGELIPNLQRGSFQDDLDGYDSRN